jgi:hypothetical protein
MANRLDTRNDEEVKRLLQKLPPLQYTPLIGAPDLQEVAKVFEGLPELQYPINSASELIEKLGGADRKLNIVEMEVDPVRMIKYMPAYYFPIVSPENFIEKMGELIRVNRKQVDVNEELAHVKRQLSGLKFPIDDPAHLLRQVMSHGKRFTFQGGRVDPRQIMDRIPPYVFPIQSQEDFDNKISALMLNRPLLVKE